jgi:hypothetical protein
MRLTWFKKGEREAKDGTEGGRESNDYGDRAGDL